MPVIESPIHGAVLTRRQGAAAGDALVIEVLGRARVGSRVTVNDRDAIRSGERFTVSIPITEHETDIRAVEETGSGREEHVVRVVRDRYPGPRYRFFIDDNSWFLRDLAAKQPGSLFDSFYLRGLRDLNQRYGVKVLLNLFYSDGEQFDLSRFPDRYRGEWADNAGWLRLAFHARSEFPDRPYQYASPSRLADELDQVAGEILRFAGESAYSVPTIIHWAMISPEAMPVMVERGVRVLSALPRPYGGVWDLQYFLDNARSDYLNRCGAVRDFATGITYSAVDVVVNSTPLDAIVPRLEQRKNDPYRAQIMDIGTHEQYFWPHYKRFVPDHFQRLDRTIGWLTENGYAPVFFHQDFPGA